MKSKFVQTALLAALIGGGTLGASAWAMSGGGKPGCDARHAMHHGHGTQGKHDAQGKWEMRREARLADLKAKLKLAPTQEAAWQSFVDAGKAGPMPTRADRETMRDRAVNMTAPERMDAMLQKADTRRARMAERSEAVKAFYGQLTSEQRAVFDALTAPSKRGHGHPGAAHMRS
jgi:hypothetical protein